MSYSSESHNLSALFEVRHPLDRPHCDTPINLPSKTMQAFVDESKISTIYERFTRSGVLPPPGRQPQYGDVSALNRDLSELHSEMQATTDSFAQGAARVAGERKAAKAAAAANPSPTPPAPAGGSAPPSPTPPVTPA